MCKSQDLEGDLLSVFGSVMALTRLPRGLLNSAAGHGLGNGDANEIRLPTLPGSSGPNLLVFKHTPCNLTDPLRGKIFHGFPQPR